MFMRKVTFIGIAIFLTVLYASNSYSSDCEKAKTYFDKAVNLERYDTAGLIAKEDLYGKAVDLCPTHALAQNNLGDVYEKQGRFYEAIAQYKKAAELNPKSPYPCFGLGDIYFNTNRYGNAVEWYEKGLSLGYAPVNKEEVEDFTLTKKQLAWAKDILKGGVIKEETIRGIMATTTRGPGEIVSITFGEGLIPFDYDKHSIRPDAKKQLDELGKALKGVLTMSKDISVEGKPATVIEIAGHTDIRGTDNYNFELSKRRAEAVVDYLAKNFEIPKTSISFH